MLYEYDFQFAAIEHLFLRGALVDKLRMGHVFRDSIFYAIWSVRDVVGPYGEYQQLVVDTNMPATLVRKVTKELLTYWAGEIWREVGEPWLKVSDVFAIE